MNFQAGWMFFYPACAASLLLSSSSLPILSGAFEMKNYLLPI